jgi:hypothetical protein
VCVADGAADSVVQHPFLGPLVGFHAAVRVEQEFSHATGLYLWPVRHSGDGCNSSPAVCPLSATKWNLEVGTNRKSWKGCCGVARTLTWAPISAHIAYPISYVTGVP